MIQDEEDVLADRSSSADQPQPLLELDIFEADEQLEPQVQTSLIGPTRLDK